jgi:hypothetical protein
LREDELRSDGDEDVDCDSREDRDE